MGTINYTFHEIVAGNAFLVRWASLSTSSGAADTGQPFPSSLQYALSGAFFSDKSVHIYPYAAASETTLLIQGSNRMDVVDPAGYIWATLSDANGNALIFSAADATTARPPRLEQVLENPWVIRPIVTSVTNVAFATQTVTVDLLLTSVRSARSGM